MVNQRVHYMNKLLFKNSTKSNMLFDDVFESILYFVNQDPSSKYKLAIGTDSQVKEYTRFITAIHIHRIGHDGIGKGAWGCINEYIVPRRIVSLREKISIETSLTQEVLCLFDHARVSEIVDIILPHIYKGADFTLEAHIDIGKNGATRDMIQEMVGRFSGMGIDAKIKPDSYAASSYADRYTK